jgi:hypothetical protein
MSLKRTLASLAAAALLVVGIGSHGGRAAEASRC